MSKSREPELAAMYAALGSLEARVTTMARALRRRNLGGWVDEWLGDSVLDDARQALEASARKLVAADGPDVIVVIEGGVADVTVHRHGIRMLVRDYDIDGLTEEELAELERDEQGDPCHSYTVERADP